MRVTRRGWAVVAIIGFCVVMAAQFGARSLNAIVAPLALVLLAGFVTVYRIDRPQLSRYPVDEGYPGDRRTVAIGVDVGSPISVRITDQLPSGVRAVDDGNIAETTLRADSPFQYDIELERRGNQQLGPVSVRASDIFGLVTTEFTYERTTEVLVYPTVYDLRGGARHDLQLLRDAVGRRDREEFDHLREYARGDSLRDIHWKSAAKRTDDELVVKEFVADTSVGSVGIAGECIPGAGDELASALASVATYLLRDDIAVGVRLTDATLEAEAGEGHRLEVLRSLALVDAGEVTDADRQAADILLQADALGVTVVVGEHEIPFERLSGEIPGDIAGSSAADQSRSDRPDRNPSVSSRGGSEETGVEGTPRDGSGVVGA